MADTVSVSLKYVVIACILIGLGIGVYTIGSNKSADALAKYKKDFDNYQTQVVAPTLKQDSLIKQQILDSAQKADSLKKIKDAEALKLALMKQDNAALHTQNEQLAVALMNIAPDTCKAALDTLTKHFTHETDSLNNTIALQDTIHGQDTLHVNILTASLTLSENDNASLRNTIANFPKPPGVHKFLGITLPHISTGVAFLAGTALGVTAHLELPHL